MIRKLITGLVFSLALGGSALRADQFQFNQQQTIPVAFTDWSQLLTFQKFDPNLGTLTMVVVRLSASLEANLCAENRSSGPVTIMGQVNDQVSLTPNPPLPGVVPIVSGATSLEPGSQNVGPYNSAIGCPMPDGDQAFWTIPVGTTVMNDFSSNAPAILAQFTGPGNVSFTAASSSSFMVQSSNGNAAVLVTAAAGATVTVIYKYIPEPTALGLLAMGALALLRRGRRR